MAASPIPFNKPFIVGKELYYIARAVAMGNISGDGYYTKACARLIEERFRTHKVLMTPSCTAALEMAARLCDIQPGDEVILPSYTFVSTANAFVGYGAKPVFVDIRADTLNLDEDRVEAAVTGRTKAIVPVHYAGVGCAMDRIAAIAGRCGARVVEDAAQGVNAYVDRTALGTIGDLGTYSFHETKNFICGEGGALCINRPELVEAAEIIRDKGTNRQRFYRGEVDKYTWVSLGSSYVPSEVACAFLYAQLEQMDEISARRAAIYRRYQEGLAPLEHDGRMRLPVVPPECDANHHLFYILLPDLATRDQLMEFLRKNGVLAVFHYVPLHTSPMGQKFGYRRGDLPVTEDLSERLLRLPMYYELSEGDQERVMDLIEVFFARVSTAELQQRRASA